MVFDGQCPLLYVVVVEGPVDGADGDVEFRCDLADG